MTLALDHIRVLTISADGATVDLGLGFAGTDQGAAVTMRAETLSATAFALLHAGHQVARNAPTRVPPLDLGLRTNLLPCDRMAVTSSADGVACLVLRFGATELAVEVSTTELRTALAVLEAQALGGIVPPTPRLQ